MAEDEEVDWHVDAAKMTPEMARALLGDALFGLLGPKVAKTVAWRQSRKAPEKRARWLAGDLFTCVVLDGPFENWGELAPAARARATATFLTIVAVVVLFVVSFLMPQTGAGLLMGEFLRLPAYLLVPFLVVSIVAGLLAPDAERGVRVRLAVAFVAIALALASAVALPGGALTIAADAPYATHPLAGTVRVIGVEKDDSGDSTIYKLYVAADDLPGYDTGDYLSFDIDGGRYEELRAWCDDIPPYMSMYVSDKAKTAAEDGKPLARIEMLPSSGQLVSIVRADG